MGFKLIRSYIVTKNENNKHKVSGFNLHDVRLMDEKEETQNQKKWCEILYKCELIFFRMTIDSSLLWTNTQLQYSTDDWTQISIIFNSLASTIFYHHVMLLLFIFSWFLMAFHLLRTSLKPVRFQFCFHRGNGLWRSSFALSRLCWKRLCLCGS